MSLSVDLSVVPCVAAADPSSVQTDRIWTLKGNTLSVLALPDLQAHVALVSRMLN